MKKADVEQLEIKLLKKYSESLNNLMEFLQDKDLKTKRLTLIWSAKNGLKDVLNDIVNSFKVELNFRTKLNGFTLLHYAARYGQLDFINHLITEHKLPPDYLTKKSDLSVLHCAAMGGHVSLIQAMIDTYENLSVEQTAPHGPKGRYYGMNVLHFAARDNQVEAIMYLIEQYNNQLKPETRDANGWTMLHHAAYGGHIDAIEKLTKQFPILLLSDKTNVGRSIIHCAGCSGSIDRLHAVASKYCSTLDMLRNGNNVVKLPKDVEKIISLSLKFFEILLHHEDLVQGFLETCDPQSKDMFLEWPALDGLTALQWAKENNTNVVKYIEKSHDVDQLSEITSELSLTPKI